MDIKGGNLTKHRKNIAVLGLLIAIAVTGLLGRLAFLMILRSEHYSKMALELHRKGQILRSTPNTAPLICGACNTQPEGLSTMA